MARAAIRPVSAASSRTSAARGRAVVGRLGYALPVLQEIPLDDGQDPVPLARPGRGARRAAVGAEGEIRGMEPAAAVVWDVVVGDGSPEADAAPVADRALAEADREAPVGRPAADVAARGAHGQASRQGWHGGPSIAPSGSTDATTGRLLRRRRAGSLGRSGWTSPALPSDVHASATTDGIAVSRPDDLAPFTEHGGPRETSQTLAAEDPIRAVYDFRYQFPDAAFAKAFLDAAETELGEVWSGAERQSLPSSERPVPDTRLYRFEDTLFDMGIVALDYLMRLDTLVAKVFIESCGRIPNHMVQGPPSDRATQRLQDLRALLGRDGR